MGKKKNGRRTQSTAQRARSAGQNARTTAFIALIRQNNNSMKCTSRSHQTPDCIVSIDPHPDRFGRARTSHTHDVRAAAADSERQRHRAFNVRPREASPAPAQPRQQHSQIPAMEGPALEAIVRAAYQAGAAAAAATASANQERPAWAGTDEPAPRQKETTPTWADGPDQPTRPCNHDQPTTSKRKASSASEGERATKRRTKSNGHNSDPITARDSQDNGSKQRTQARRETPAHHRPEDQGGTRSPEHRGVRHDADARNRQHSRSHRRDDAGQRPRINRYDTNQRPGVRRDSTEQRRGDRHLERRRPRDHSNPGNRPSTRESTVAGGRQQPGNRHDATEQRLGDPLLEQRRQRDHATQAANRTGTTGRAAATPQASTNPKIGKAS